MTVTTKANAPRLDMRHIGIFQETIAPLTLYGMKLLPPTFAVQCVKDCWVSIEPIHDQPPGRMFDRSELHAVDCGALGAQPAQIASATMPNTSAMKIRPSVVDIRHMITAPGASR